MSQKGSSFEREISKALSLWWSHGNNDAIFWRSTTSGARATQRRKNGLKTKNQNGDITATDPIGQDLLNITTIELKKGYNSYKIQDFLDSRQQEPYLTSFLKQCKDELENANVKCWWLITHQDSKKTLMFFNYEFWSFLNQNNYGKCFDYIKLESKIFGKVFCIRFEDFINIVDPEIFKTK